MAYFSKLGNFVRPRRNTTTGGVPMTMPVPQIPMSMPMPGPMTVPAIPRPGPGPMHVGDLDTGNGKRRRRLGLSDDEYGDDREEEEDERVEIFVPDDEDDEDEDDDDDDRPRRLVQEGETPGQARMGNGEAPYVSPDEEDDGEVVIPWVLVRLRPYRYRMSKGAWKHIVTTGLSNDGGRRKEKPIPSSVKLITWNIDMSSKLERDRFRGAIGHIREDVLKCKTLDQPVPECIIMLQEVKASLFADIRQDTWIRRHFIVLPIDSSKWPEEAWYGNVTLVHRGIPIAEAHILHFGVTSMQRTGLCVKVRLAIPGLGQENTNTAVIGLVNTHLESLPKGVVARRKQMEMCAWFLKQKGVLGGVVVGDMNAILDEDERLEKGVGLRDAWKGKLKSDEGNGNTWGYQGQTEGKYPPNRLDRVFYSPGLGFKVDEPKLIGVGITIREGPWVSDHYGLESTLTMLKPRSNSA